MTALQLPVVLVGPMGVGKTTVGKKLANALQVAFIDTDAEITRLHGSIPEIFATLGEPKFREFEAEALGAALTKNAVIATGGGAVLSSSNREKLKGISCVYLATDGRHMAGRLQSSKRPLLQDGMSDWRRIYDERKPLYREVASLTIDTSSLSLKAIVEQIEKALA